MSEENEPMTDGSGTGIVPPDDETPSWPERKERSQGLARLTYEYFERARYEDQTLRQDSSYVERDVLGFPAWPHETMRNLALTSFFVGMMIFVASAMPVHMENPANPNITPPIILPDWYLYWSFGLLQLDALNPDLAILGGQKLMSNRTVGVLLNVVVVGAIAVVPFLNKGSARRPVEEPFWASVGVFGVIFAFTISMWSVDTLIPGTPELLLQLTFLLPFVGATISYAVLKAMREGYMFELNRRYYRLRPPR